MDDTRTLQQLAREALLVQDACNLSGVVHGFSRAVSRLRAVCPELGTTDINRHPLTVLWVSKLADLSGADGMGRLADAMEWAERTV